jgi:predicted component of type VI protein secretion system
MIQLHVLTGSSAGQSFSTNQFPVSVGRNPKCSVPLADPGVFDTHFEIQFSPEGFVLQANSHTVVYVNDATTERAILRNGDVVKAGLAKLQFSLGTLGQRGLRAREVATWLLIGAAAAAQAYLLLRLIAMAR